ncbi:MAG TPA: Stp1/IreP family PP2C-type Ser/Thr phosphatase [Candidatus Deferrimicrobiaceae bacterium]
MRIISHGGTDPGRTRTNNEDAFLVNDGLRLYAVADGIGGREGGEIASRIAVDMLREAIADLLADGDRTPAAGSAADGRPEVPALRRAVALMNRKILDAAANDAALAGMGTTLTALLLAEKRAYIAHVGDSRLYRLRSGKLAQLTNDHSMVAEQVRAGLLTAREARTSPYRHVITRALGIGREAAPDVVEHPAASGDTFLLCTDGLTDMLDDREIGAVLASGTPRDSVKRLIDAANARGGVDNITVVVVQVAEA